MLSADQTIVLFGQFVIGSMVILALVAVARWGLRPQPFPGTTRILLRAIVSASTPVLLMGFAIFLLQARWPVPSVMVGTLFVYPMVPAIPGLLFVGIGVLMLVYRTAWPLAGRVLYALPRNDLKAVKSILWWCGLALLALAVLPVSEWWKTVRSRIWFFLG